MGRRSRHTAKTGDAAVKRRAAAVEAEATSGRRARHQNDDDDDDVYDKVDRFFMEREKVSLEDPDDENDENDGLGGVEGVMDLGAAVDDESDEDDDSDDEDSDEDEVDDASSSDSSASSASDPLRWGRRKRDYYHGDTADLEIGQEFEDAELEEEAGREVRRARAAREEEDDFAPFSARGRVADDDAETTTTRLDRRERLRALAPSARRARLETEHPEFFPVVSYFASGDSFVKGLRDDVAPVADELLDDENGRRHAEAVGANAAGLDWLRRKRALAAAGALNLCVYLLLKSEEAARRDDPTESATLDVRHHPVVERLDALSAAAEGLEKTVERPHGLREQLSKLVQAVALMKEEGDENDEQSAAEEESDDDDDEPMETEEKDLDEDEAEDGPRRDTAFDAVALASSDDDDDRASSRELRFGARPGDVSRDDEDDVARPTNDDDYGEDDDSGDEDAAERRVRAGRRLASTVNALAQRKERRRRRRAPESSDAMDAPADRPVGDGVRRREDGEDLEEYERGLRAMEEALGPGHDDDDDDENMDEDEPDDLYARTKRAADRRRERRARAHAVAPKFPRADPTVAGDAPRKISDTIMKNRGLVAHKNKLNRNPRVKKREQYRKALVRRRGAVRDVRDPREGDLYGGEDTGVRSQLVRSRKLGSR